MKTWSKYIVGLLVIIGSCIGSAWLPELLNISQDLGVMVGIILGFLISFMIPGLWKSFLETVNTEHHEAIEQKRYIGIGEMLIHPTYLPFTLGMVWFIVLLVTVMILKLDASQKWLSIIIFTPFIFSIGLSGLEMFKRGEMITGGWFGYVLKKTKWAVVLGVITMAIGFGGSVFFVMSVIFNW